MMALVKELRAAVDDVESAAALFGDIPIEELLQEVTDTQAARRERAAAKGMTVEQLTRSEAHLYR